ncbi:unnamed protein product [Penicillium glandicola]
MEGLPQIDAREWYRIQKEEKRTKEEAKRIRNIKKANGEIPWWEEDEEDTVKPTPTFEQQQKCIEELKHALDICRMEVNSLRNDRQYMDGNYDRGPEIRLSQWEDEINNQVWMCRNWILSHCIRTRRSKCEILSQEQKKVVIASLEGWIVQDDFDTTVSRLPPNIRYNILGNLASMMILKDCLRLFWSNPFWYLDVDGEFSNSEDVEAPFGTHLNTLYKEFLKADVQLAHHWRAQTTCLANVRHNGLFTRPDPAFGIANEALQRAKAYRFAAAKLEDKAFRCLVKDEDEDELKCTLGDVYFRMAKLARGLSMSQPFMEWRLLDKIPAEFELRSKVVQAARNHWLGERESRLNGHKVLAILQPYFYRSGGWDRDGGPKEIIIHKAHVFVEDPVGVDGDAYSSDEDAFPVGSSDEDSFQAKKKRKTKKVKIEKKMEAGTQKPAPKGKAKKGAKKRVSK